MTVCKVLLYHSTVEFSILIGQKFVLFIFYNSSSDSNVGCNSKSRVILTHLLKSTYYGCKTFLILYYKCYKLNKQNEHCRGMKIIMCLGQLLEYILKQMY